MSIAKAISVMKAAKKATKEAARVAKACVEKASGIAMKVIAVAENR
jgi:hypothetical protein